MKREKLPRKMKKRFKNLILFFSLCGKQYQKEQERNKNVKDCKRNQIR